MALFYVGIYADIMGTFFAYNWLATAQVMFATYFLVLILYIVTRFPTVFQVANILLEVEESHERI